jgi:molybdopterin-guanine dinucleotide biosynthesis protein A
MPDSKATGPAFTGPAVAGPEIAGVILTGGRSRRMGGGIKALVPLSGKPLIRYVIDRMRPQVQSLVLSVEKYSSDLEEFDLAQVEDPSPGSRGPLGGLLSALSTMDAGCDWLLLAPCDAPFLPPNLAQRLLDCAIEESQAACAVRYETEVQPTFSLWHRNLLPRLEQAVLAQGMAGFKQFMRCTPVALLDWERSERSPFFNINDPDALARASCLLDKASQ